MKQNGVKVIGATTLVLCLVFVVAALGCPYRPGPMIQINAGRFAASSIHQYNPGNDPALQRLATVIRNRPDASRFILRWQNVDLQGNTEMYVVEYDRDARTVTVSGDSCLPITFEEMTDESIYSASKDKTDVEDLNKYAKS